MSSRDHLLAQLRQSHPKVSAPSPASPPGLLPCPEPPKTLKQISELSLGRALGLKRLTAGDAPSGLGRNEAHHPADCLEALCRTSRVAGWKQPGDLASVTAVSQHFGDHAATHSLHKSPEQRGIFQASPSFTSEKSPKSPVNGDGVAQGLQGPSGDS